ncbi:MAG: arginine--tRNA ligase, partial [Bacteroidales bacterium]|nr:arginine--tRNA ligase [Bacteroidales bacterium]
MNPEIFISNIAKDAVKALYGVEVDDKLIQTQATRKEFEGDITLVAFPLLKMSKKSPEATGAEVGEYIKANEKYVENYNVVKGFLYINWSEEFWKNNFSEICAAENYGQLPVTGKNVRIEFSSPNTNKPLHLGHIRNNLLGWSVSRLLEANGHNVIR